MSVKAVAKSIRISPRKVRLVTRFLAGKNVVWAERELKFLPQGASKPVADLLGSAIANAENNFDMVKDNLFIKEIKVGEGVTYKRWRARSRGMAAPIKKRTSHIYLLLDEKVKGKKKDKSAKKDKKGSPKVVRVKTKKDINKALDKSETTDNKKKTDNKTGFHQQGKKTEKKSNVSEKNKKGFMKNIFRRKAED